MGRIRVLIVDDSAFMRHALGRLLGETGAIEVVGAACNGVEGLQMAAALRPDVITLDVEMPVLDGLAMLKRLMLETPTRVVMLSSRTTYNARVTLDALEFGAIDFVPKPSGSLSIDIGRVGEDLLDKIQTAAGMSEAAFLRHRQVAAMNVMVAGAHKPIEPTGHSPADTLAARLRATSEAGAARKAPRSGSRVAAQRLVVIAASTGGPMALHTVVKGLPAHLGSAVVIVQHMPPGFTASLASRLDSAGGLHCAEATSEDVLIEDETLVAPGDRHMLSTRTGHIQLAHLPTVNGVRPAADVTLQSVAPIWRERLLCVVLTGMGWDAREGARSVKLHGGTVIAQDAATSTIYGMPGAVVEAGLADRILPLGKIAAAIAAWSRGEALELPVEPAGAGHEPAFQDGHSLAP